MKSIWVIERAFIFNPRRVVANHGPFDSKEVAEKEAQNLTELYGAMFEAAEYRRVEEQ